MTPEPPSLHPTVVVDGCRTPFQKAGTGYRDLMSYQLAAAAIRGVLRRTGIPGEAVDRVILGATVSNPRTTNVAREAALEAGLPACVPALTLVAAGASATAAIAHGADLIATGQADVVIAGGTDCVSDPPIGFRRPMRQKLLAARRLKSPGARLRFLLSLRPSDFLPDMPDVTEFTTGKTMGQFTEELAHELGITRQEQDAYALESHRRAARAWERGDLGAEVEPVTIPELGLHVESDNGIRADSTLEQLGRLPPSFDRTSGTLTAGNSSYLTDGAAVVVLASAERAKRGGMTMKARLHRSLMTAHDPATELLLGPVFAIPRILEMYGLGFSDVDVFEIHEAFAAQVLAVVRRLGSDRLDPAKTNTWGGSLAIGNPFAPNGARLVTTAVNRLHREGGRFAVAATCAGGGLGHSILLERT